MAAMALFMMTSCSDDDSTSNNNNNTDNVLLKKTIIQSGEGTITSNYTYNGTKLVKITGSDGSSSEYFYTGDQLTRARHFGPDLDQEDFYTYDSQGRLTEFLYLSYNVEWGNKNVYTYNQDGTITVKEYIGDVDSQTQLNDTGTITLQNGNITKYDLGNQKYAYTFDSKNSPSKNITGDAAMTLAFTDGGLNNQLTYTSTYNGVTEESSVYSYTYNSDNYPVTSTEVLSYEDEEETITTQYFYE